MSSANNWKVAAGDPVLESPAYLKYSGSTFSGIDAISVKADLVKALASNESAGVVAYLSWLLRTLALVA